MFVVEGRTLVEQAVAAGWQIDAQFVAPGGEPVDAGGTVHRLAPNVVERVGSTETPRPLLALVHQRVARLPSDARFVMVADGLADPGNAGTIIRSAEAAGADAVVFTPGSVDVFNPKVVRATAGSLFRMPVLSGTVRDVRNAGITVFGTSSHRGLAYTDADFTGRVAILVGNEAHGVADDAEVDAWITIPHAGPAESLNVAMAATVLAFEVARQRRAG